MNVILRLAWRNLWRHSRRTWLTIGAMVFSNALLVFMISLQFGMYDLMIDNTLEAFTGHLQVQADGYRDDMKMRQVVPEAASLADRIRETTGLETVAVRSAAYVLLSSDERSYGVQVFGVDPGRERRVSSVPGLVRDGNYLVEAGSPEIVIGSVLARNLRVGTGAELTLLGSGLDGSFAAAIATVAGIFESGVPDIDRGIAEVPIGFFDETFYMNGAAHAIVVVAPDLDHVDSVRAEIEPLIRGEAGLVVNDWNELQPGLRQAIQADMSSAFFMYAVLVVLVAFSVMNTQLMSVLERTHEFGIVMALGLTAGRLGRLVLLETLLMGAAGLLLGACVGGALTLYFQINGFSYPGMDQLAANFNLPSRVYPRASFASLFLGPAIVLAGTIAAALYPALRLHRLQPVAAMRAL